MAELSYLVGYADKISAFGGDRISVMASSDVARRTSAALVRLGPGEVTGEVDESVVEMIGPVEVGPQWTCTGSFMSVAGAERSWEPGPFVAAVITMPTRLGYRSVAMSQSTGDAAWSLGIDEAGRASARTEVSGERAEARCDLAVLKGGWYLLAACFDPGAGISLACVPVGRPASWWTAPDFAGSSRSEAEPVGLDGLLRAPILVGAETSSDGPSGTFDGKLELPQILSGTLEENLLSRLVAGRLVRERLVVGWDFATRLSSLGTSGTTVHCEGAEGCDGILFNTPTEAVTGHSWDASVDDFRLAPAQYGAIHFHVDDLDDCRWEAVLTVELPTELSSGAYAIRLSADHDVADRVPFFVRPADPEAPLLFLAPTASYLAYANDHPATDGSFSEAIAGATPVIYEDDLLMHEHREWGLSCYDSHRDGSGVAYSTRLRPLMNMRPTHRYHVGPWQLAADLRLLRWLDDNEIAYEVATDEDLHREGLALLSPYRAVVTGTHPEYHSTAMLDALESYLDGGGRLAYLGANGFYWRVAFDPERPWLLEVRRGQGGSRPWDSAPGESYLAFGGERCGQWRHLGRSPHKLTATGYSAQGFDRSGFYRRLPDSFDPSALFIFEGVSGELFGTKGSIGGGSVGQELDRYDLELGSPNDALVLATSEGLSESYQRCTEDILFTLPGSSAQCDPHVRADVVYHVKPGGGAVFCAGSIAWTGALGLDQDLSRITRNVLQRFVDPAPLPWRALDRSRLSR